MIYKTNSKLCRKTLLSEGTQLQTTASSGANSRPCAIWQTKKLCYAQVLKTRKKVIPFLQQYDDSEENVLILGHSEKALTTSSQMVRAGFNVSGLRTIEMFSFENTNYSLVLPISCYPFYNLPEWKGIQKYIIQD